MISTDKFSEIVARFSVAGCAVRHLIFLNIKNYGYK